MPTEIIELNEIDSTNDELRRLAEKGAKHFTVVTAKKQTRGKGRYSRMWESPDGNLFLSILIRKPDMETAHQLSFVSAMAVLETVQTLLSNHEISVKWPNDVLVNGKKIAGILLESSTSHNKIDYIIIGFGVNVKKSPDYATNMRELGYKGSFGQVKDTLIKEFKKFYEMWQDENFGRISELWLRNAAYLGEKITVNLPDSSLTGIFRGLTATGELRLETVDGEKIISSGDVYALQ